MSTEKIPIIAVAGPTASGKTALSIELAKHYDAEILSFDSMQVYEGMEIGTAKPVKREMQGIPHHMIGTVKRDESFSVAKYKAEADRIIHDIFSRGKNIVMVGGTGLYLDSVMNNIELLEGENDSRVRDRLCAELERVGPEEMHLRLKKIDPKAAESIHPNNTGRVIRALEVYETTGHTMSYQVENSKKNPSCYNPVYIGLTAKGREYLYDRINKRVDIMLSQGLLYEAEKYLKEGSGKTARQAICYKELAPYLLEDAPLPECIENLKRETRRYAKRQLTWFRRNPDIHWIYIDETPTLSEQLKCAEGFVDDSEILKKEK